MTDAEMMQVPVLEAWLRMCAETPEFVNNYNRLRGTALTFTFPPRSPIAQMIDRACDAPPSFGNDPEAEHKFFDFCKDTLLRLPMLQDPKYFQPPQEPT